MDGAKWTQNGSVTPTAGGLTAPSGNGGSLISRLAVPDGTSEYEVKTTLTLVNSGGAYVTYLRASPDALSGPTQAGAFYSVQLLNPTFSGGGCAATLAIYKRVGGVMTVLSMSVVPCRNGMVIRSVARGGTLVVSVDDLFRAWLPDGSIAAGQPGVGGYQMPGGNAIARVELGPLDRTAPAAVNRDSVGVSAFSNAVEMQWQGAADDAQGVGVLRYDVIRNDNAVMAVHAGELSDQTVSPSTNYTYTIYSIDYHGNYSAGTNVSVATAPANSVDPRRVGVRPLGSYWGAAGEQIDTLSGNLNFTLPLLRAQGRGGWGVPFALSYNSQHWRQDSGGTWKLGRDLGYGFGWRLLAGSLTPCWTGFWQIHHWVFTDASGAEYRLEVNTNGTWSSREGIYVEYDEAAQRVYFADGSFWVMGAVSAGTEEDAGTRYPTRMQDSNGNQVMVRYLRGAGVTWVDSSARISEIEDVRAVQGANSWRTYSFTYSGDYPIPHLTGIDNYIGTGESYDFTYAAGQGLYSPFSPPLAFGTTTLLGQATQRGVGLSHSFEYAGGAGELTRVTLPYGGYLRWQYRSFPYLGGRTLREVEYRYLVKAAGAPETFHQIVRNPDDGNRSTHWYAHLYDGSPNDKVWWFATDPGSWAVGLPYAYQERASNGTVIARQLDYTWVQDALGRPYLGRTAVSLDPYGPNQKTMQTEQDLDIHGNVTETRIYDYGNLSTPARTYTHTYVTNPNYTSRHMWNRLLTTTLSGAPAPLVTNTYDGGTLTNRDGLREHDAAYGVSFAYRGNVTRRVTPGAVRNITYDIGGAVVSVDDGYGHGLAVEAAAGTNYAAPGLLTPNGDAQLATSLTYSSFLGLTSTTNAATGTAQVTYDGYGRPATSTSPHGAVTNYYYHLGPNVPMTITGGRVEKTTLDGLGRPVKVEVGQSVVAIESVVETEYEACACSPLGKVKRVSQPYAPGGTKYWTTYTYDALGRTTLVELPDGTGTISYLYEGNKTKVTGPVSTRWKQYTVDAMGNLLHVTEPAPEGGTHETSYTYNVLNQLSGVSMPRGSPVVTQTRTFVHDLASGRLTSASNPENGTTTYTYNADGTLASRTDAKGQRTEYVYDTQKQWLTQVRHLIGGVEDTSQQVNYTYEPSGRLATVISSSFTETFGYTAGGLVSMKRLESTWLLGQLTAWFGYTAEGRLGSVTYPASQKYEDGWVDVPGPHYTMQFDALGRPVKMISHSTGPEQAFDLVKDVVYGPAGEIREMKYAAWDTELGIYDRQYRSYYQETRSYNNRLQMTRLTLSGIADGYQAPAPPPVDLEYRYPAAQNDGRITHAKDWIAGVEVGYTYDTLGRLTSAVTTGPQWGMNLRYDGFGNLTAQEPVKGSAPSLYLNYDQTTNRILGLAYDANGNLASMGSYDVENRLVASGGEQYAYGAGNRRLWSNGPGGAKVYFYGPDGRLLATYVIQDARYTAAKNYVYFAGKTVWTTPRDSQQHAGEGVVEDRLGSWVRPWGTTISYPYGENANHFGTYLRSSANGLDYAVNRWYSSGIARFLTPDPSRLNVLRGEPQSWNLYSYVVNDPVNENDPSGLGFWSKVWNGIKHVFGGGPDSTAGGVGAGGDGMQALAGVEEGDDEAGGTACVISNIRFREGVDPGELSPEAFCQLARVGQLTSGLADVGTWAQFAGAAVLTATGANAAAFVWGGGGLGFLIELGVAGGPGAVAVIGKMDTLRGYLGPNGSLLMNVPESAYSWAANRGVLDSVVRTGQSIRDLNIGPNGERLADDGSLKLERDLLQGAGWLLRKVGDFWEWVQP